MTVVIVGGAVGDPETRQVVGARTRECGRCGTAILLSPSTPQSAEGVAVLVCGQCAEKIMDEEDEPPIVLNVREMRQKIDELLGGPSGK